MYATTKLSKEAPIPALNKRRVRMLLDEQSYAQAVKVTKPVRCRCAELATDPKVLCPSHWLSAHAH
ncbi:MAG TPA: hypothetical protein V6C97_32820 [Oculatellaceae cyanobacterium]